MIVRIHQLNQNFEVKQMGDITYGTSQMGDITYYLGIGVERKVDEIYLISQE